MKQGYIYIILIGILLIVSLFILENDTKTFKVEGIKYAVSVNGVDSNKFPEKGPYEVTMSCEGATGNWNYEEWAAEIYDIVENVSCTLEFNSKVKTNLNNYIKNLIPVGQTTVSVSTKSTDDGSTLEKINSQLDTGATSTDYRYRGTDPNNYIRFNDELWRIIGVFDQYSHGQTGQHLVKIIRNDSIGGYAWRSELGSLGNNNFYNGDVYKILNTAYYNAKNETGADYCEAWASAEPAKCNFTNGGIQDNYRGMIKKVTWYLGGYNSNAVTSSDMYKYERSTNTSTTYYYSGNAKTLTNTPVGLMYASDYGYAAPSSCVNNLANYDQKECGYKNWLKQNTYEWTITHNTSSAPYVFYIYDYGDVRSFFTSSCYETRPTIYLDSSVYYISGDGSQTSPYIIAMD